MLSKTQSYVLFLLALMLSFIVQLALSAAAFLQEMRLSFKAKLALLFAPLAVIPSIASAAVPASVTTGITEAVADVGTVGAAILGVIIVIASFNWLRRVTK